MNAEEKNVEEEGGEGEEGEEGGEGEGCNLFTERSVVLLFWDALHRA